MALFSDLPVYKATYDLLLAIFRFTKDFSKDYKYTVGESIKKETIELITIFYRMNKRIKHQRNANNVFAKAGLDNVTSAIRKHQQRFRLDIQFSALVHNFNSIFSNGHLYRAGQSMNSLPSQIPERWSASWRHIINDEINL